MVADVEKGDLCIRYPPPHSGAGGSYNKTRWVRYLCEINSRDKAVIREASEWVGNSKTRNREQVSDGNPPGHLPARCQRPLDYRLYITSAY